MLQFKQLDVPVYAYNGPKPQKTTRQEPSKPPSCSNTTQTNNRKSKKWLTANFLLLFHELESITIDNKYVISCMLPRSSMTYCTKT